MVSTILAKPVIQWVQGLMNPLLFFFSPVAEGIIGINILSSWSKRHYDRKGQEEVPETEFIHPWTR